MSSDLRSGEVEAVYTANLGTALPEHQLSSAAVGHLAHDMRGALHTILGHAELLALDAIDEETRDSAEYIRDAAERLRGMCDDVTDLLRLPTLPDRGSIALSLGALVDSVTPLATVRGSRVRMLVPCDDRNAVVVDATTQRVIAHVVEHVVRMARSDVTLSASVRAPGDTCMIVVAPAPEGIGEELDGVIAIAAQLLAARGAHLATVGWRLEILVPVVR